MFSSCTLEHDCHWYNTVANFYDFNSCRLIDVFSRFTIQVSFFDAKLVKKRCTLLYIYVYIFFFRNIAFIEFSIVLMLIILAHSRKDLLINRLIKINNDMVCVKVYDGLTTLWIFSRLENHCWCLTGSGAATPWRHDSDSLHALNFCLSWYAIIHGYPQTEMCHFCKLHIWQFYWWERYFQIVRRGLVRVGNGHRLVQ